MARKTQAAGSPISEAAVTALRDAATRKAAWSRAKRDPVGYLRKLDIALPDGVGLDLYDMVIPEGGLVAHGGDVAYPLGGGTDLPSPRPVPASLERWWEASHGGCPFGTYPSTTTRDETVCLRWGFSYGGRDWVPDREGSASGHFELTGVHSYCLLSRTEQVTVVVCLPLNASIEARP